MSGIGRFLYPLTERGGGGDSNEKAGIPLEASESDSTQEPIDEESTLSVGTTSTSSGGEGDRALRSRKYPDLDESGKNSPRATASKTSPSLRRGSASASLLTLT